MAPNGKWADWIDEWLLFTEGEISPELFRLWAGIAAIGAAAERRVWVKAGDRITFANQFIWLVGPPGTGKYVIELVRGLLEEARWMGESAFRVAPDSVTKASLVDALEDAKKTFLPPDGTPAFSYCSLLVAAEEAQNFMSAYDLDFLGLMNKIWNNPGHHEERRRYGHKAKVDIVLPQLSLLWGVQPGWLSSVFPEEAWSTGLTSRTVMVYTSLAPEKGFFAESARPADARQHLIDRLGQLAGLWGQMKWQPAGAKIMREWFESGGAPAPGHSKLQHYLPRRIRQHAVKLVMVATLSRSAGLVIEEEDVRRAIAWLLAAEATMADIFRAMVGKSDRQVIEDLHDYMFKIWGREKKSVPSRLIANWLSIRLPSDKIDKVWSVAERAGIIARVAGTDDLWVPRPKHEHGQE